MPKTYRILDTGYAFQVQRIMISLEGIEVQKSFFANYVSVALDEESRFFVMRRDIL